MNLKETRRRIWQHLNKEQDKGRCCDYVIISKIKEEKKRKIVVGKDEFSIGNIHFQSSENYLRTQ